MSHRFAIAALCFVHAASAFAATPRVVVAAMPGGIVQLIGQGGGADTFSLTNLDTVPAPINLSTPANFFTMTPTTFALASGATQVVTLIGKPQNAGFFEGTINVGGAGLTISVRLFSAAAPTGTVQAAPTSLRADVITPGIVISPPPPIFDTVNFTNTGNAPLQAIAVADVPWIDPEAGVISIQPGQTRAVAFSLDATQRPDGGNPLGGSIGKLSLVFPTASQPKSTVSITIVFVVAPDVALGSPPPLGPGELALFFPGFANKPTAVADLLLGTKKTSPTDLKIYFQGSTVASRFASFPQIAPNTSIPFQSLLQDVFKTSAQSGTVQIRGSDLSTISAAAVQLNTASSSGTFGTALPILRSDQGIRGGEQMMLSGVLKEAGIQTDLYVQEMSGTPATVTIEFLDASGSVSSARSPDALAGFGFLELTDAVPSGVVAVRITNNSSGASRISGYAMVLNQSSGDAFPVTDPALSAATSDDTFLIPLIDIGPGAQTLASTTNRVNRMTSVVFDVRSTLLRRRTVTPHDAPDNIRFPTPLGLNAFDLAAFQTLLARIVTTPVGHIRVVAAPRTVSVAARSTRTLNGKSFGTGLPVVPASAAIAIGDLKRFTGVEDGSAVSRLTAAGNTFQNNLVLIEAAGQATTVRVTLAYVFIAGAAVSAKAVNSKDYVIPASQYVVIRDVIRDVIGNARDVFGDLHNIQIDVEVTQGGHVVPFLHSIDYRSGDSIVRTE